MTLNTSEMLADDTVRGWFLKIAGAIAREESPTAAFDELVRAVRAHMANRTGSSGPPAPEQDAIDALAGL